MQDTRESHKLVAAGDEMKAWGTPAIGHRMFGERQRRLLLAALTVSATIGASAARAQDAKVPTSIWDQQTLTGDWGGERTALSNKGVTITVNSIDEILGVLSGGVRQQASYEGRTEFTLETDWEKLTGWAGATTRVTVFQIRNSGYDAADNVGSLADPSNIDALATTRLFTAWFQQNAAADRVSFRIGQLAADDEFMTSTTAGGLIGGTFGWPSGFASNLPSGGPAYPLATPGARLTLKPTDQLSLLAAVFSGNPAGADCTGLPQACDRYGTTFSFSGGAFAISELQYAVNQGKDAKGLAGVYKLGAWYHTADFADEHFGLTPAGTAVSLADTSMVSSPLFRQGNFAIYGVADQTVWQQNERSLSLFVRASGSPADRNLLSYYVDGGAGLTGLVPGREKDVLTLGFAYEQISRDAAALDQDILAISGPPYAVRDHELFFEASYTAQVAPWWMLQPDVQYFVHPNGGQNPTNPTLTIDHALLAGIRSTIKF